MAQDEQNAPKVKEDNLVVEWDPVPLLPNPLGTRVGAIISNADDRAKQEQQLDFFIRHTAIEDIKKLYKRMRGTTIGEALQKHSKGDDEPEADAGDRVRQENVYSPRRNPLRPMAEVYGKFKEFKNEALKENSGDPMHISVGKKVLRGVDELAGFLNPLYLGKALKAAFKGGSGSAPSQPSGSPQSLELKAPDQLFDKLFELKPTPVEVQDIMPRSPSIRTK